MELITNGQDVTDIKGEALGTIKVSVHAVNGERPAGIALISADNPEKRLFHALNDTGEVTFLDVVPGGYEVLAVDNTKPFHVVEMSSSDQKTSGNTVKVIPGAEVLVSISVVEGSATIEGFAKRDGHPTAGAMVVLVPKESGISRSLFRRDQSDLDGSFTLSNVAPGSYTVIAIEDGWDLDWAVRSVINRYLKNGEPVTISRQDLRKPVPGQAASSGPSIQLPHDVDLQPK